MISKQKAQEAIAKEYKLYIDGKWVDSTGRDRITSYNPSDGSALSEFVDATEEDVDRAVDAAHRAFKKWKSVGRQRGSLQIFCSGNKDGRGYRPGYIDNNTLSIVLKEPIGVVGQIVPWNFPILMAAWKIAPALAAGDTIVIHLSSSTSLSLLELVKLIGDILPKGVLNLVTGKGSKSGDYMLGHEGFSKLAFTGSTEVGYRVAKQAADRLIPATLELGGKSANIFFEDAPWEKAIEGAQLGILFN